MDKVRFGFWITGYADPPHVLQDHFNNIGGRALMHDICLSLVSQGYACDHVDEEDYGWSVLAEKSEMSYHIALGVWSEEDEDQTTASEGWLEISVWDIRKLLQRLFRRRNKPSIRDTNGAAELRTALQATGHIRTINKTKRIKATFKSRTLRYSLSGESSANLKSAVMTPS